MKGWGREDKSYNRGTNVQIRSGCPLTENIVICPKLVTFKKILLLCMVGYNRQYDDSLVYRWFNNSGRSVGFAVWNSHAEVWESIDKNTTVLRNKINKRNLCLYPSKKRLSLSNLWSNREKAWEVVTHEIPGFPSGIHGIPGNYVFVWFCF